MRQSFAFNLRTIWLAICSNLGNECKNMALAHVQMMTMMMMIITELHNELQKDKRKRETCTERNLGQTIFMEV